MNPCLMRPLLTGIALIALATASLLAQTSAPASRATPTTPTSQVAALVAEYEAADEAFFEDYGKAKTPEERAELLKTKRPKASDWFARMRAVADAASGDEAAATALLWIASHGEPLDAARVDAVKTLLAHHRKSKAMVGLCSLLARDASAESEVALRDLAKSSDDRTVRAQATFSLGMQQKLVASQVDSAKGGDAARAKRLSDNVGAAAVVRLAALDAKAVRAGAEALLDQVVADFADCPAPYRGTLGASATAELFEMRNLAIGKVAPEITGENLNGETMSLAAFRGKVVVLDFWGNW